MSTAGRRYVEFVDLTGLSRHTLLCPTDTGRVHGPLTAWGTLSVRRWDNGKTYAVDA
jgi:hypothetical protein